MTMGLFATMTDPYAERTDILRADGIELDRATGTVTRGFRRVHLSPTEFRMLIFLMENPGIVLSRQRVRDGTWGAASSIAIRTVDVHIGRLRRILSRSSKRTFIRTVHGQGYIFGDPGSL